MKSSIRIGFAFILQLALSSTPLAEEPEEQELLPNLVLLPIESTRINSELLDSYRVVIARSLGPSYKVFSGANVDSMLQLEFDKQCELGGDADDISTECVQNVAGDLNADLVALPKIIQTEEGYLVTLEISDVFTEQLITTYSETCVGCTPLELTGTFREMIENADAIAQCTVSVRTRPFINNGEIYVNGQQDEELTPAVLKLDIGQYIISINSADYFGEATLDCATENIIQLEVPIELISTSSIPVVDTNTTPIADTNTTPVVDTNTTPVSELTKDDVPDDNVTLDNAQFSDAKQPQPELEPGDGGWYTQLSYASVSSDVSMHEEDDIDGATDLGKISQSGGRLGLEIGYFRDIGLGLRLSSINTDYLYQSQDPSIYDAEEASGNGFGIGLHFYLTRWLSFGINQVNLSEEVVFDSISYSPGTITENIAAINITSMYGDSFLLGLEVISRSEELDSEITQGDSNFAIRIGYRFD